MLADLTAEAGDSQMVKINRRVNDIYTHLIFPMSLVFSAN